MNAPAFPCRDSTCIRQGVHGPWCFYASFLAERPAPTRAVRTGNIVHTLEPAPPLRAAVTGPYDRAPPFEGWVWDVFVGLVLGAAGFAGWFLL